MKEKMIQYVKERYPEAIIDCYYESKWGKELQFYYNKNADDVYTCVCMAGTNELKLYTEF